MSRSRLLPGLAALWLALGAALPAPPRRPPAAALRASSAPPTARRSPAAASRSTAASAAASDGDGRFRLAAPPGAHRLRAELDGFLAVDRALLLPPDGVELELVLEPKARFVEEVVVAAVRAADDAPASRTAIGIERLERRATARRCPSCSPPRPRSRPTPKPACSWAAVTPTSRCAASASRGST